jgi:hypothetical protein
MPLARLLAAALLLCSAPGFAQTSKKGTNLSGNLSIICIPSAATPSEPWRIVPNLPADLGSRPALLEHLRNGRMGSDSGRPVCRGSFTDFLTPAMGTTWLSATTGIPKVAVLNSQSDLACYAIRSYLVARDSKDSDSTHPAGYSTCLPSDRYRVKSAEIRTYSVDH